LRRHSSCSSARATSPRSRACARKPINSVA
jgi:hypothetical protein